MSPVNAPRARRSVDGVPTPPSDEELLAWSRALVANEEPRPSRPEPLRAERRAQYTGVLRLEEVFAEIEERERARMVPRRP